MSTKHKLLVVDNEIDVCNFVKSFFEVRGFDVYTALHGDDAMKLLDTLKPDLIILDMIMRRHNEGLEYLPQIKVKIPQARIIMITGVDDQDVVDQCRKLGVDDYITKPLVLENLESTVMKIVEKFSSTKR